MALNLAWAHLRQTTDEVYIASGTPNVDLITCADRERAYWTVHPSGELTRFESA